MLHIMILKELKKTHKTLHYIPYEWADTQDEARSNVSWPHN
jgi:hypothetical protein